MTTVVNNPGSTGNNDGGGFGFLIGTIILVAFVAVLLYFGIPAIRNMGPVQINMPAPQINIPAPQVNVPENVKIETTPTAPAPTE